MPRKRPGAGGLALSTLAAYFFLSVAWAAQPSEHFPRPQQVQRNVAAYKESLRERGPPGPEVGGAHDLPNHDSKNNEEEKERLTNTINERDFELETLRASQTFAPAHHDDFGGLAVRASAPAHVLPSAPISDRSLQDWVMEDLILMATVDGSLHARDRRTGQERWILPSEDYPMVETTYNRSGLSEKDVLNRMYWVIEPSDEGEIYLYYSSDPGEPGGLEKLPMSIKKLVDNSPYSVANPHLVYTASRSTTLYSLDAKTGDILALYGGGSSSVQDKTTCRKSPTFGGNIESECKVEGSLSLGRVTYNIWIQSSNGDLVCSIRYSEWIPNKRDQDLHSQYRSSMDQSYVYTSFNGRVTALKHEEASGKGRWNQQLPSPVTRVFDIVRPAHTELRNTELVLLPQPVAPMTEIALPSGPKNNLRVYVNQTKADSFYALSELTYPTVTQGAKDAQCYNQRWIESLAVAGHKMTYSQRTQSMIGVHLLTNMGGSLNTQKGTDDKPRERLTLDGPSEHLKENQSTTISTDVPALPSSSVISNSYIASSFIKNPIDVTVILLIGVLSFLFYTNRISLNLPRKAVELRNDVPSVMIDKTDQLSDVQAVETIERSPEITAEKSPEQALTGAKSTQVSPESSPEVVTPLRVVEGVSEIGQDTISESLGGSNGDASRIEVSETSAPNRSRSSSVSAEIPKVAKVRILEPTVEELERTEETSDMKLDLTEDAGEKKKKARRGQRGGKRHRRGKKGARAEDGADEDDSADIPADQAAEIKQDSEPAQINPDAVPTQTVGNPTTVNDTVVKIGNLTVFKDHILGYGSHGTRVFRGTFGDRDVAVKAMLKEFYDVASQEVNLLQESDDHRNVIRYYDKETAGDLLYIALELCPATLGEVIEKGQTYSQLLGPSGLDRIDALRQITRGLRYLHSLKIVHRDIKPENILVAAGKKRLTQPDVIQPPRMLISDFGLCKKLDVDQSSFRATTAHAAGTSGWRAPELLVDDENADNTRISSAPGTQHSTASEPVVLDTATNRRATRAIDIFALGCIFFYVLSGGNHPFDGGEGRYFREVNIIKGRHDLSDLDILGDYRGEAEDLIANMITREPKQRPDAGQILAHPFFWSPAKRLDFLCHVSDQFEFEPRDPPSRELQILEDIAPIVLQDAGGDFLSKLPQSFMATLAKQRKYQGGRMLDVLRALRNKKNHYEDMPPNVKAMVGSLPEGYLLFWTTRFPLLLMGCHQVVKQCGWHKKDRFKDYYEAPTED